MPTPRQLINAAVRHQVFLERLKAGEIKGLVGVVAKLDKATRDALAALDVSTISDLSRRKLDTLLSELRTANETVLGKGADDFMSKLEGLAGYEAGWEARAIAGVVASDLKLAVPNAAEAYRTALAQPLSATGQRLPEFMQQWTDGEVTRLNNVVQRAWGEGWTPQRLTQSIRGTKALGYNDGVLATTRRNAEAVGRTSIQHVASMGRQATWEKNSDVITGYKYIATLDSRTTQVCRSLDGKVFKVGSGPVPPVHINCRSTTVAELDPALDFLDEGATRSSENGYVAADQTYYDWLKQQPASFQDEAIGKTRGKLFRDGGLTSDQFAKLNLNRNFEPLTLDEMRRLEPLAFEKAQIPPKP